MGQVWKMVGEGEGRGKEKRHVIRPVLESGRRVAEQWRNSGRTVAEQWQNSGRTVEEQWQNSGRINGSEYRVEKGAENGVAEHIWRYLI